MNRSLPPALPLQACANSRPFCNLHRRLGGVLALGTLLLAGCASMDPQDRVMRDTATLRHGPEAPPQRLTTGFSESLRCMDNLFLTYNVHDVSVLVEDLTDQTKKVNAGTKDMLISAVSDMTVRSRAIRLVVYGTDTGNIIGYLSQAGRKSPYGNIPQFDIKGSVSQLDENLVKEQGQAGISLGQYFNLGSGRNSGTSVLGVDLTVLSTDTLSVVPGVTSRNSIAIVKSGEGLSADATIQKFGANYGMSLSHSDGQAQALRTLVELAAIELLGKLTRTPYWVCLNANPSDAAVRNEISDWFQVMMAQPQALVAWSQEQLRNRLYYLGPVDGLPNEDLKQAVTAYRVALGLSPDPKLDMAFFTAYLNADHWAVTQKHPPPPRPSPPAPAPLALNLGTSSGATRFKAGEDINVTIAPNRDAWLTCYWQDEMQQVLRVFPNRFNHDGRVAAEHPLHLPGAMKFHLIANSRGAAEHLTCFATEKDVMAELPAPLRGTDFEPMQQASLEQVRQAFQAASHGNLTEGNLHVQAQ